MEDKQANTATPENKHTEDEHDGGSDELGVAADRKLGVIAENECGVAEGKQAVALAVEDGVVTSCGRRVCARNMECDPRR